jgi:hypothetical protein
MKTIPDDEDSADQDLIPAPSFSLEAFREFLTKRLCKALDAILEWGDEAARVLAVSTEKLHQLKDEIAACFFDYKRMCMPLGH